MNDNPTSIFSPPLPIDETIIAAEIVDIESFLPDTSENARLFQQNQALLLTITQLKTALFETNERLQTETRRLRSCETLIAQQNEELNRTHQQLQRTSAEVESYRQTEQQKHRSLITLSEDLLTTQQKVARMERECTLMQEHQHEKTQKLLDAEQQIDELRSRLQRQQRYTLQYKAALDQCLGGTKSPPSATDLAIVPQASSIEPWSSQEEIIEELTLTALANEDAIDDFLAEFERMESFTELPRRNADWPSPIISPLSSPARYPAIRIDLPAFLKSRTEPS